MPRSAPAKLRPPNWPAPGHHHLRRAGQRLRSGQSHGRPAASSRPASPCSASATGSSSWRTCWAARSQKGDKGEFGLATLELDGVDDADLPRPCRTAADLDEPSRPGGGACPPDSPCWRSTGTCAVAAIAEPARGLYGVQFHPGGGPHHARPGDPLEFRLRHLRLRADWDPRHRIPQIESEIRERVGDRNVFFFVSGGVDSTVAYTLCLRALGAGRACAASTSIPG